MFQLGELVVYGVHGVCRVSQIQEQVVDRVPRQYLVLEPVSKGGSQYMVPMHNAAAMNKLTQLLSPKELEELFHNDAIYESNWIQDENRRKQFYRDQSGAVDRQTLMQTVHTIYSHRDELREQGKKLHVCDENFLHDAEKVLSGEIGAVLDLNAQEALQYLRNHLKQPEAV